MSYSHLNHSSSRQTSARQENSSLEAPENANANPSDRPSSHRGQRTGRRQQRGRGAGRARGRPRGRNYTTRPRESAKENHEEQNSDDGGKSKSGGHVVSGGRRYPRGRLTAGKGEDGNDGSCDEKNRRGGSRDGNESRGVGAYYSSSFTKESRELHRRPVQSRRYSRRVRDFGRKTMGRYQTNSRDQIEQSVQSGELTEQLLQCSYDCVVCCETVRPKDSVWNCLSCYHLFHLNCIQKWARSSAAPTDESDNSKNWRCPCCQNSYHKIPSIYYCFCGKVKNPSHDAKDSYGYICPHSCGDVCGKQRDTEGCIHKCTMLCHPGPCPRCPAVVNACCPCGKTISRVQCSQASRVGSCGQICGKQRDCGRHTCNQPCHTGLCQPCEQSLTLTCFCCKTKKMVSCSSMSVTDNGFSCGEPCGRPLDCKNHSCEQQCHPDGCPSCPLLPRSVHRCPCSQTPIIELLAKPRTSCLDPIPTCDNVCGKQLTCGNLCQGRSHYCQSRCHVVACPPCVMVTQARCQCGQTVKEIPCSEFCPNEVLVCDRLCNKKKNCGRHRCSQRCCSDTEHLCLLLCNKLLRCGRHRCEEQCHQGHCPPCYNAGFDELRCHCGAQVIYPPIPCGTLLPSCDQPCFRIHDCSHPVLHNCHGDETCPPCPMLVSRMCMGGHRKCANIPCHMKKVSCGSACGRLLACGQHTCKRSCHEGACLEGDSVCTQPCALLRSCGHECGAACHPGSPCPKLVCKVDVRATCKCGRKTDLVPCMFGSESSLGFSRLTTEHLITCMRQLELGQSFRIDARLHDTDVGASQERLECDEECAQWQRNKLVAEALKIDKATLSAMTSVQYSPFLLEKARKEPVITARIESELINVVERARKGF
ncbi:transcriptional repressor NF-X1-like isoform X2 [Corticium candelabrum]|uniref:transcriptional repressor NF-X1-like isoform X2 n=1 Tax=Corticium candelabrum TaxID=121492 RepID=UPI002E26B272|nr:transcriptional repressor NF-X1-like isoform X2 [Corticium candelabrum]